MTIVVIFYLLFLIVLAFFLILIFLELFQDFALGKVPFIPTTKKNIKKILQEIDTNPTPKIIYDLGAGDARFLILASKKFPQSQVIGYENSVGPYLLARLRILFSRSKAKLYFKNFFKQNISNADVVFCFLGPEQMEELKQKFDKELKPGTKIISSTFPLHNKKIIKTFSNNSSKNNWGKIFFYQK